MSLAARGVFFDDLRPKDVGGHEVRGKLDAAELQADRIRERFDQERLCEPWNASKQTVTAGEQAGKNLSSHLLLADDDLTDLIIKARNEGRGFLEREGRGAGWYWRRLDGHG